MRGREYAGPLGVLAAGILGISLLCSVSALAKSDLYNHNLKALEPVNFMDLAVANLSTSVALTQQVVTAFVSTPTIVPADTASLTPQHLPADTAARTAASPTPLQPTRTRRSQAANTVVRPLPTQTRTPVPAATSTPVPTTMPPPPTDTPLPPPPATEPPPPTDTSAPPPADTQPPPTDPPIQILDSTSTPSS